MDIIGFGGGSSAPSTGGSAMPPVKMGDKGDFAVRAISCDYAAAAAAAAADDGDDDVDNVDGWQIAAAEHVALRLWWTATGRPCLRALVMPYASVYVQHG